MAKVIALLVMLLTSATVQAQIVDTWAFSSQAQRQTAMKIAGELRCPQCQNQNLLESNAPVAVSMRREVFAMVEQGKNESEIMTFMTQRYGDFVQYNPPLKMQTGLLWLTPLLLLLAIIAIMWWVMRRQNRRSRR